MSMRIFVTGGCGFIGANFLNKYVPKYPEYTFVNIDTLTYAANPLSIKSIENRDNYVFEKIDVGNWKAVDEVFAKHHPDLIIHFAAESHVDRSIVGPRDFIQTNIQGTFNLLEACRKYWKNGTGLFHHVSTDEVYGSLGNTGFFTEETRYDPSSPYSASKAASDHLVRAYFRTYKLPIKITNCSNNYGPYQFPEKLIPLMILNILENKPLPIYGTGSNVRDWLYVEDHCDAIWHVVEKGQIGETYNIGGNNELKNIEVVDMICQLLAEETKTDLDRIMSLKTFVPDRPGHDLRYAIDATRIRDECGWEPQESFESGFAKTVKWYTTNPEWVRSVQTGEYLKWIDANYGKRKDKELK